ncbi:MAG: hypothetical protein LBS77_02205 [Desulfovibrio sp.]|jgi:hypothetical protein|nr:hypothetical protein [Desulfovibrio sp.]
MPIQQETFRESVMQILEAVMFENWLRFYFIAEKTDATHSEDVPLFIAVPDKGMERIRKDYAHLLPMAEAINEKEADFKTSRRAVCTFVMEQLDGKTMSKNTAPIILESATFQAQLQLFNLWVQSHEAQLDENFLEFSTWRSLFAEWRKSPDVRSLEDKLLIYVQTASREQKTLTC